MAIIDPPGVLLRRHGLTPRKAWGQNFLHDPNVLADIAAAVPDGAPVLEIGAGLGTLTGRLLAAGHRVHAIERDRDLCAVLRAELGARPDFALHEADAVTFDYGRAGPETTIVGNLPYHLTGPLLFRLLAYHAATGPWIVMVQREVAERLLAAPGSRRYGGTTVALGRVRAPALVRHVARGAFLPAPRVDSAVVRLDPRPAPLGAVPDEAAFLDLVRRTFQRRRKTLQNALAWAGSRAQVLAWCRAAGADPRARPETLDAATFAALARARAEETAGA